MNDNKIVSRKVTVTFINTFEDGTRKESTIEFDHYTHSHERGIRKYKRAHEDEINFIEPNGHYRLQLNAWKGFERWDDFKKEEERAGIPWIDYTTMRAK